MLGVWSLRVGVGCMVTEGGCWVYGHCGWVLGVWSLRVGVGCMVTEGGCWVYGH